MFLLRKREVDSETPKPRSQRGFSLIELMIAITLLGVGVLSLAGLFPLAMQRVVQGDRESRAAFLAQSKMEEIKALSWASLSGTAGADTVDVIFARDWIVVDDSPAAGMKQVQVNVGWSDSKGPRNVTFSSYLSDSGF